MLYHQLLITRDTLQEMYDSLSPWEQHLTATGEALLIAIAHTNSVIAALVDR